MSVTAFRHPPAVPDIVARLDPDIVVETLSRHAINVSEAASELGVGSADLRRLLWAKQRVGPSKGSVEFGVEVGVEAGQLTALIVKGSGTANLKIALHWEGHTGASNNGSRGPA